MSDSRTRLNSAGGLRPGSRLRMVTSATGQVATSSSFGFRQERAGQESMMHRNIARAYDCLQAEHARIRTQCIKILAQNDRALERRLLRANLDSPRHHD